MRGIGHTLSRLPTTRAFLAGAAVLATMVATKAHGQSPQLPDETAMAVTRLLPRGRSGGPPGIALPQPLAPSDAARIRRIFTLQARGEIAEALRQSTALHDIADEGDTLIGAMLGHLVADRHLGPHTRTSGAELRAWLERWPDLPDAPAVHSLLARRLPQGAKPPPVPVVARLPRAPEPAPVPEETEPAGRTLERLPAIDRTVREAARSGAYGAASKAILAQGGLPPGYAALLRGEAGQILFALNRDREAYEVAAIGAETCRRGREGCVTIAAAGYWAGLAAWRMDRPAQAGAMFELAWAADIGTSAQRAGAAFWAARAHLRQGETGEYLRWLARAAAERRTFYGLIARRALDLDVEPDEAGRETLAEADLAAVAAHPPGLRAFALLQLGQRDRAEAELRLLWPEALARPPLARAVMLVAEQAGLPNLAAQMADLVQAADGRPRPRTRFAVPRLRPAGGFTVDPALVYAIARTESNFDPDVVSRSGARGLMQLMPATARFLIGDAEVPEAQLRLDNPSVNLELGQRYLNYLAATDIVGSDKIRLLASYNSGPTAFGRWSAAIRDAGDPLLFIEAIPIDQTRAFVPRVLAYTWLYAARLRLPDPSLDELAAGLWPRYGVFDTAPGLPTLRH